MKRIQWVISAAFCFVGIVMLFGIAFPYSQTVYVTDEFEITMRTGGSIEHKVIAMLPSGTKLQVIKEKGDWILAKSPTDKEGWILKRYVSVEMPKKIKLAQLQKKYQEASKQVNMETEKALKVEKENKKLRSALNKIQGKFENVNKAHTNLIQESKDFLTLKKDHTSNVAKLRNATSELKQLRKENKDLRSSNNIKWFLSGAGVMFLSWLIGYLMGKTNKRSRKYSL
jgi:SH3 domain protein